MDTATTTLPDSRRSWRRFSQRAAIWLAIGLALLAVFRVENLTDRDIRTVASYVAIGVTLLAVTIAWLRWAPVSLLSRMLVAGSVWLVILAANRSINFITDGDARIIGWRWDWKPDPDEMLGRMESDAPAVTEGWEASPNDFPRFLGTNVWAEVTGVELATDWRSKPPQLVWKRPIGAGWSAFAIVGQHAITQEQRGANELVTCYALATGEPEWSHADEARFDPQTVAAGLGDIGPRATPTFLAGRIYTLGALGQLNCLDAPTGNVVWSVSAEEELHAAPLFWGNSSSPLVLEKLGVVVFAIGNPIEEENCLGSLVALELETGKVRWQACPHTSSYASPVLAEIAGEPTLLMVNENVLSALDPTDGKLLWEHPWPGLSDSNASCSQPVKVADDQVLLTKGYTIGSTLLKIGRAEGKWSAEPVWTPAVRPVLKTKFSNIVVRDGHAYGLNDGILECVEIATGQSEWKKRRNKRFGHGQILLVGETLLVLSESGELVAVRCSPQKYEELGAIQALEGKTWNNMALSGELLLVRNDQEAACYRLLLLKTEK